jgi:hypothetical protein
VNERTYRTPLIGFLGILAVLSVISLVAPVVLFAVPDQPFLLVWLAGVAFGWYTVAYRMAYEITVIGQEATFRSLLRRLSIPLVRIRRLESHARVLWIWSDGRRLDAFPIRDLEDFVRRVREANPAVEVD